MKNFDKSSLNSFSNIAIIPARGGSKRIKRKNIKEFCGQPIIKYSVDAAKESGIFEDIIVSTENEKIARVAKKLGASVPSLRLAVNSRDDSTLADMMLEEIDKLEARGAKPKYLCLIFATAPTISSEEIIAGLKVMKKNEADSVVSVCEFTEPIGRALKVENGFVKMLNPKNKFKRTQDLEKRYFDAGRFYWIEREAFKKNKSFFPKNTYSVIISKSLVQDIDTPEDWKMMEVKFKFLKKVL